MREADDGRSPHPVLWVGVLDGLRVLRDGRPVGPPESAVQVRSVLRMLAVRANQELSKDTLVDRLWTDPPASARNIVEKYVSAWRRELDPQRLVTVGAGYRLRLSASECDLLALQDELRSARRRLATDPHAALPLLCSAFDRWGERCHVDGEPVDVDFDDLYVETLQLWADACVRCDSSVDIIAPLRAALARHPYRERLTELLMAALHSAGRSHEATLVFHQTRERLADDLGADPGPGLQQMLSRVLSNDRPAPPPVVAPAVVRLPPRNGCFTGRTEELSTVEATLGVRPGSSSNRGGAAVIVGGVGLGKSAVALEFSHRHKQDYGCASWLRANLRSTAIAGLEQLAEALGVRLTEAGQDRFAPLWVEAARRHTLLVLDDAGDPDQIVDLLPVPLICTVVVTTRDPGWSSWAPALELPILSDDDARMLVGRLAPNVVLEPLLQVCAAVDRHALGLVQAVAYMLRTGMTAEEYLGHFRSRRRELLRRGAPADHPEVIETTWQLVATDLAERNHPALHLLRLVAFLGNAPVPIDQLGSIAEVLPTPLSETVAHDLELEDSIAEARRYSLLSRDHGELDMHYLTRSVIADTTPPEVAAECRRAFVRAVVHWDGEAPDGRVARWLVPHIRAASEIDEAYLDPGMYELCWRAVDHLLASDAPLEALDLAQPTLRAAHHPGGIATPVLLGRALTATAEAREATGQQAAAVDDFRAAVETLSEQLGHDHPTTARALGGLTAALTCHGGVTTWKADELIRADASFAVLADVLERAYGPASSPLARVLSGWGQICQDRGILGQAVELQDRSLAILIECFGPDHPEVGHTHDKLAVALTLAGDLVSARRHFETALRILRAEGGDGPHTAWTLSNLSMAHLRAHEHDRALSLQEQAKSIFDRAEDMPHAGLIARWRIARILIDQGRTVAARRLLRVVCANLEACLGADHPDTTNASADLADLDSDDPTGADPAGEVDVEGHRYLLEAMSA